MEEKEKEWCGKVGRLVDVEVDAIHDRVDRLGYKARYGEYMMFRNVSGCFQVVRDVEKRRESKEKVSKVGERSQNAK